MKWDRVRRECKRMESRNNLFPIILSRQINSNLKLNLNVLSSISFLDRL